MTASAFSPSLRLQDTFSLQVPAGQSARAAPLRRAYRRIGFLFNHDQIHQIRHSLPIALALRATEPGLRVIIAVSNEAIAAEVTRIAHDLGEGPVELVRLALTSRLGRAASLLAGKLAPAGKALLYRDNLDFFRSLDALVVTERTSLMLKTRYGLQDLPIFLADHGAGDRAIGFGGQARLFDHVLAAGPKIRDRMIRDAGVDPERISITGYPKFDAGPPPPFTPPPGWAGRPTVLYNPHPAPHLSSWYRQGRSVLEFFLRSARYNLIFAPHIMLFQRPVAMTVDPPGIGLPGGIPLRYRTAPNILIDISSRALVDMTYTAGADIYLGDASSQVYEFLSRPRPCVFLNPHRVDWCGDDNFAHWRAGPVISTTTALEEALDHAQERHVETFLPLQRQLVDYTFDRGEIPSARRAAERIAALVA